jgi:hypothetical protein
MSHVSRKWNLLLTIKKRQDESDEPVFADKPVGAAARTRYIMFPGDLYVKGMMPWTA